MGQCCSKCCDSEARSNTDSDDTEKISDRPSIDHDTRSHHRKADRKLPKSSERTPLLPHNSPAVNYSQQTPRMPIVQHDQLHQEPPVTDDTYSLSCTPLSCTPRGSIVQLEPYPPAQRDREADQPAQAEPHPFESSIKLEPCVSETTRHYSVPSKEHVESPFMFDDETLPVNPLPQSHKLITFGQSIKLSTADQDQVTPPSNVHTPPPQHYIQRASGSNRQTGDQQMLHKLKVSPLSEGLEIKCPMWVSSIMQGSCDHNGRILISNDGVKLTIPKGAITDGDLVTF